MWAGVHELQVMALILDGREEARNRLEGGREENDMYPLARYAFSDIYS